MRIDIRPTPSDQLSGLTAASGPLVIKLSWFLPVDMTNYRGAQVWVNTVNDLETSSMYTTSAANGFDYPVSDSAIRYFWIRAVDQFGRSTGPFTGPASGVAGLISNAAISGLDFATLNIVNKLSAANITGLGALALLNELNASSVTGLGYLATQNTISASRVTNLGDLAYADQLAANQIGAGQLAAGVIYAGTLSANQIKTGSLSSIGMVAGSGGEFSVNGTTGAVFANIMTIYGLKTTDASGSAGQGATSARSTRSGNPGINASSSAGHGIESSGGSGKYAYYAYGTGGYGPFTGSHDVVWKKDHGQIGEVGDIVIDHECIAKDGVSNTLFEVELSSKANQKGVIGVLNGVGVEMSESNVPAVFTRDEYAFEMNEQTNYYRVIDHAYSDLALTHMQSCVNSVGEGQINVCGENGNIERGDLIVTSSMPGKGMKQDDDLVRSYTVAKAREAVVFNSPDQVKMVACIYLCG